jgi:hypothetical protein
MVKLLQTHQANKRQQPYERPHDMNVQACAMQVLTMFRPPFSTPMHHRFLVLVLAAMLTTARHTITNLLRTVRARVRDMYLPIIRGFHGTGGRHGRWHLH